MGGEGHYSTRTGSNGLQVQPRGQSHMLSTQRGLWCVQQGSFLATCRLWGAQHSRHQGCSLGPQNLTPSLSFISQERRCSTECFQPRDRWELLILPSRVASWGGLVVPEDGSRPRRHWYVAQGFSGNTAHPSVRAHARRGLIWRVGPQAAHKEERGRPAFSASLTGDHCLKRTSGRAENIPEG